MTWLNNVLEASPVRSTCLLHDRSCWADSHHKPENELCFVQWDKILDAESFYRDKAD